MNGCRHAGSAKVCVVGPCCDATASSLIATDWQALHSSGSAAYIIQVLWWSKIPVINVVKF